MEIQTLILLPILVVAGCYLAWSLLPHKKGRLGCASCPKNRYRRDDYA